MLQVDESYAEQADPDKLIPMATCNSCYDLRRRLGKMEDAIKALCHALAANTIERETAVLGLKFLAGKFSSYCADTLHRRHLADAGALADLLIDEPRNWWRALREFESQAEASA